MANHAYRRTRIFFELGRSLDRPIDLIRSKSDRGCGMLVDERIFVKISATVGIDHIKYTFDLSAYANRDRIVAVTCKRSLFRKTMRGLVVTGIGFAEFDEFFGSSRFVRILF